MKHSSEVMYRIGRIFAILFVVGFAIAVVACSIVLGVQPLKEEPEYAKWAGKVVECSIWLAFEIVALALSRSALKDLANGNDTIKPHVICIVCGAFGNVFFILGGIFGLVARSQAQNANVVEAKSEEKKED